MTALERLTEQFQKLPEAKQEAMATAFLEAWEEFLWDLQIESDAKAGKLDHLIAKAKQAHKAGETTPLVP